MPLANSWTLEEGGSGLILSRPRPSIFSDKISFSVPATEVPLWRSPLPRIAGRVRHGHFRTLPLSFSLRCLLGVWRRNVTHARYYGGLPRSSCHLVGLGASLYLLMDSYAWGAYPVSSDELQSMASRLT